MNFFLLASGDNPISHVADHPWVTINAGQGYLRQCTLLSNHIIMLMVAAVLLMLFLPIWVRPRRTGDEVNQLAPRGMGNLIELICEFLRDKIASQHFGPYTDRFISYIWTVFFFILTCNLLGLLPLQPISKAIFGRPIYGTATGNIWVTGTLAAVTFLMIWGNGLRLHGMRFIKHFFIGPFPINVLIAFLECVGLAAKSFALCIRLFANMCAGHILLAILVSFIAMAGAASAATGFAIALPVVLGSVAINGLELFVAFLQAFIFTFLSCVFIGQAVNIHHEEHETAPAEEHEAHGTHRH
ncbi:MAG TPA: F0F1 ATP synthase subunit A [Phycisphaerae bacterium]|nr:F0F1 ATP synthase subunit A [Phycisphaerae bacterium]